MPYELRVEVEFPAAHHLVGYPGDCARPHGHNWVAEIFVRSKKTDSLGMAYDFRDLKNAAKELVAAWDHQDLNTLPDFKNCNPSAEQVARIMYEKLSPLFPREKGSWLQKVTIWENSRCAASYFSEENG